VAFFQVVAVDFDGTLTSRGEVSAKALAAIDQARRSGLVVVLVTGRIELELAAEFPQIAKHVDAFGARKRGGNRDRRKGSCAVGAGGKRARRRPH